jgi:hypothetical protein
MWWIALAHSKSQKKITIIIAFPIPNINVKAFLRLIGYYKRFIASYAEIAEPLFALTKKECKFNWTPIW